MSSRSESRFKTASWMGLTAWTVKLATSARGWTSWKPSPLLVVMGLHLARKRTKPATAIKFKTSRTFTRLKEAIKEHPKREEPGQLQGLGDNRVRAVWRPAGQRKSRRLEGRRTHPPTDLSLASLSPPLLGLTWACSPLWAKKVDSCSRQVML